MQLCLGGDGKSLIDIGSYNLHILYSGLHAGVTNIDQTHVGNWTFRVRYVHFL